MLRLVQDAAVLRDQEVSGALVDLQLLGRGRGGGLRESEGDNRSAHRDTYEVIDPECRPGVLRDDLTFRASMS